MTDHLKGKRAILYARVSKDDQAGEGHRSLKVQSDALLAYAQAKGLEVVPNNGDKVWLEDYTATTLDRPLFSRIMALAEARAFDVLVVVKQDRLTREDNAYGHVAYVFEKRGIEIVDLSRPDLPRSFVPTWVGFQTGTASEENLKRAVAAWISIDDAARVEGKVPSGGYRLYGFTYRRIVDDAGHIISGRVVNPTEAPLVRQMAQWVIEGASLHEVARRLNTEGIPTKGGSTWRESQVARLLRNPAICGKPVAYRRPAQGVQKRHVLDGPTPEPFELPGEHPAIISPDTFDNVQAALALNPRKPRKYHYLLTGLIRCGLCGGAMVGSSAGAKSERRFYRCRATSLHAGRTIYAVASIEDVTWSWLTHRLLHPKTLRSTIKAGGSRSSLEGHLSKLDAELNHLRGRESKLVQRSTEVEFDPTLVIAELGKIRAAQQITTAERDDLLRQLANLDTMSAQRKALSNLGRYAEAWGEYLTGLDYNGRRKMLLGLGVKVVYHGRGNEPTMTIDLARLPAIVGLAIGGLPSPTPGGQPFYPASPILVTVAVGEGL